MSEPRLPASGWCGDPSRGASMGRGSFGEEPPAEKVHLVRIRLDRGGYDNGGAYWGQGLPLYYAWTDDGEHNLWTRAADRNHAVEIVLKRWPSAKFYRGAS